MDIRKKTGKRLWLYALLLSGVVAMIVLGSLLKGPGPIDGGDDIPLEESRVFNVTVFYAYHNDDDFDSGYKEKILEKVEDANEVLRTLGGWEYSVYAVMPVKVDDMVFGHGTDIQQDWLFGEDVDTVDVLAPIVCELSREGQFHEHYWHGDQNWIILAGTTGTAFTFKTSVPVFSADVLADTHNGGYMINHEVLHTFGCDCYGTRLPRDLSCYMDNSNIKVLNNDTLAGCGCEDTAFVRDSQIKKDMVWLKSWYCNDIPGWEY